jgi:hypothetical protein
MHTERFTPKLIAPCGMNCGICVAYFGYTLKGEKRKRPCEGCRSRDHPCAFIKKRCDKLMAGEIEYCGECTGFPCENLRKLDKRYRERFGMSMIENLKHIQTEDISRFQENEEERWRCPICGRTICIHNRTCYSCNQTR